MSGQLGDLVVSLSADIARFQSDMGKSLKIAQDTSTKISSSLKETQESFHKMSEGIVAGFETISKVATVATAVLAGGKLFGEMISETKNWTSEIISLSKHLGVSTEEASAFKSMLEHFGIDQDVVTNALLKLEKAAASTPDKFRQLGIQITDTATGNLLPAEKLLMNFVTRMNEFEAGAPRNAAASLVMGRGVRDLGALMKLSNEELEKGAERVTALGIAVTTEGAEKVKIYKQSMSDLHEVFKSIKIQIGNELIPQFTKLGQAMVASGEHGMGSFQTGLLNTEIGVYRLAQALDLMGISAVNAINLATGATALTHLTGSKWGLGTETLEKNYQASGAEITKLNNRLKGLNEDGTPKTQSAPPPKEGFNPDAMSSDGINKANQYIETWNKLQDKIREMNPEFTAYQKEVQKVNDEYATLIGKYPEHSAELEHNRQVMLSWVDATYKQKDAIKETSDYFKEYLRLAESEAPQHNQAGAMNLLWEEELKWIKEMQPGAEVEKLNDKIRLLNNLMEDMPDHADEARAAIKQFQDQIESINNKPSEKLAALNIQLEELKGNYLKAAQARQALEASTPEFKALSPETQEATKKLWAQQNATLTNADSPLSGWNAALTNYLRSAQDWGTQVRDVVSGAFKGMEDAMVRFCQTGKLNFTDMANSIISDIIRIIIRQSMIAPLMNGISGFLANTGMFGYTDSALAMATGGTWGGGHASGGPVSAGTTYLVGENGPELLTMGGSGFVTPNSQIGGQMNLTVNVVNQSGQPVKARQGQTTFDANGAVKTIILEALDTDPGFRSAVRGY